MSKQNIAEPIRSANLFPVVGIGASAGGLDAFRKLLKTIPENSGMAYVLVQHLDPNHESMLPDILQKVTTIPVSEISDDITVEPDHIYIIPSNKMLVATDGILKLSPRPAKSKNEPNMPIDIFFNSLAEVHQAHAIGVVLSGTASDGTKGLKAIKDNGGLTFAQDEASAQYEGMPHNAAIAGVVDFILPPDEIPKKIMDIMLQINRSDNELQNFPIIEDEIFKQILALLRIRKGTDFTYYKQSTIRRRILRRMALNKNNEPAGYLKFLREHHAEQDVLYQDLLIPVTSFFRDHKSFDNLCETVFPVIVKNKIANEPIRIWVAGCSTGEEAFSIAICLHEFLNSNRPKSNDAAINEDLRVQVFATDISEPAIAKARRGIYSKNDIDGLDIQRLQDFFIKVNGSYQVSKVIRDMCVFAVHNFLKDPPFAKMDMVSCRNVLIYMEPYLQKKALTTFHYSLLPSGFLLLGKSETTGSVPDIFDAYAKNEKIFLRKDVPARYIHVASQKTEQSFKDLETNTKIEGKLTDFQKTADDILLSRFTPAGVVVNEGMDIVHFRGATGSYLEPSPGKASFNLLKMIKEGLAFELRNILHKAKTEKTTAIKENIPVEINGEQRQVTIEAIPLVNVIEPHYLILFHEGVIAVKAKRTNKATSKFSSNEMDEKNLRIQQLEQELFQTREDMGAITEDQEAVNEELQSANEELLSGSEELQSLNEEMETSKEELQSTNEELIVINQEMISLNELVTEARNYAEAIVTAVKEPLIILDKHLRVKSANKSFYRTFMVGESETEGKRFFELGRREWDNPELRSLLENILADRERFSDYELRQNFMNIGERVMMLNAREMKDEVGNEKLILLSIEDITEKRVAENKLIESEKKFRTLADFIPQIIWTAQPDGNLDYYNQQWYTFTQFDESKSNQSWISLLHEDDKQRCIAAWYQSIKTGDHYQIEYRFIDKPTKSFRWFLAKASPIKDKEGRITKWFGSFTDIHEQKIAADELLKAKELAELSANAAEEAVRSKQQFLSNMSHEIRTPMNSIIGFTKVLLRTELTDKQKEYLNAIKTSGDVMIVLINDILDLAKVDAGKMTFEKIPFKLSETISSMLHLFEIKLKEKNIALVKKYDSKIPEVLEGDPVRLHQIILNLMSNAVKFTSKGKITIHIFLLSETEHDVEISFSIADTGMGIPEDKLQLIFDNFQQAYTDNIRLYGGTGLGLSIVKKLLEAQGGSIKVESKLKVGSTFTFQLKFNKTNKIPETIIDEAFVLDGVKDIKVLVVEDIALNQLLIKTLLTDFGFNYEIVENGKIAVKKLENADNNPADIYDIVLMDLEMPELNGFDATTYIRKTLQLDIPIIALTADVTQEYIKRSKLVGMNDYISKPVDEKLLFSKIVNLIKGINQPKEKVITGKKTETALTESSSIDLTFLKQRTKSNLKLITEMSRIFIEQTPPVISAMKDSLEKKDWVLLKAAAHKLYPSLTIIGIDIKYQEMCKSIQEFDGEDKGINKVRDMIVELESVCKNAFVELKESLIIMSA